MKHLVWTSDIGDVNDWRDILEDDECVTDEELEDRAYELNCEYLFDEYENLSGAELPAGFIVLANLELWNGGAYACRAYNRPTTIGDALRQTMDERCGDGPSAVYIDDNGDLRVKDAHHDGTNYYCIRAWRPGLTNDEKDACINAFVYTTLRDRTRVEACTIPLGPACAEVYGWTDC